MALLDLKNKDNLIVIGAILVLFVAMASSGFLGTGTITGKQVGVDPAVTAPTAEELRELNAECGLISAETSLVEFDKTYTLNIKMRNNGFTPWKDSGENRHKLEILEGPGQGSYISFERPSLIKTKISTDEEATFKFSDIAPSQSQAGREEYLNFKLRMVKTTESTFWARFFAIIGGQELPPTEITRFGPECIFRQRVDKLDAEFVKPYNPIEEKVIIRRPWNGKNVPENQVVVSEDYSYDILVKNIGTTRFTLEDYKLEAEVNGVKTLVPINADQGRTIAPGTVARFASQEFIAPDSTGTLKTKFQMKYRNNLFGNQVTKDLDVVARENNARCGLISVKKSTDSKSILLDVRFENTGNTLWKLGSYKITAMPNQENNAALLVIGNELELQTQGGQGLFGITPFVSGKNTHITYNSLIVNSESISNQGPEIYNLAFRMKEENNEFGEVCRGLIQVESYFEIQQ